MGGGYCLPQSKLVSRAGAIIDVIAPEIEPDLRQLVGEVTGQLYS